ncbi:MAG: histidine kinase [Chloroflexi bacterium]|nr:histidine kinase [Chloroflexota bacterium]
MTIVQKTLLKYMVLALAVMLLAIVKPGLLFLALEAWLIYVLFRTRVFGRVRYSVHVKFLAVVAAMTVLFLYVTLNSFGAMNNMHGQIHVLQEMETFQPSVVRAALDGLNSIPHHRSLSPYFSLSILVAAAGLGAAMAWSITEPVGRVREGMRRIASGDFTQPVEVANQDELGELAEHINSTARELARLHEMTLVEERERALRDRVTQVTLAQEEERRRISRELHDGLGPSLAAMGNRLRMCKAMVESDPAAAQRELDEIAGGVKGYIQEIRDLIYELRPLALDQMGLAGALDQYVSKFAHDTGIDAGFSSSGDVALNPLADVTVLRVVQESLANVQAHSDAERVEVSLETGHSLLEISVQDNGRGFDPETVVRDDTGRGVGLVSMRERAELLGGKLSIESGPGLGCRVLLIIPMEEAKLGPDNGPVG